MADMPCYRCDGSGEYPVGTTCPVCGGSGAYLNPGAHGVTMATALSVEDKVIALDTKIDALQADMDIIKPQIQAIYDDLNP